MKVKIERDKAGEEILLARESNAENIILDFDSCLDDEGILDVSGEILHERFKSLEGFIKYILDNPQRFKNIIDDEKDMHLHISVQDKSKKHCPLNYVYLTSRQNKFSNLDIAIDVTDVLSDEYKKLAEKLEKIKGIL